jgi:endonuclease/exonuclease/phosphatase family metal-dependent hydrolase
MSSFLSRLTARLAEHRNTTRLLAIAVVSVLLAACEPASPTSLGAKEDADFKSANGRGHGQFVSAMTRNLYIGTDIGRVLVEPPQTMPLAVARGYAEVIASRPAERMAAIADEIATHQPDLVGLQEVSAFYTQVPGDFTTGNAQQASDLQYDFLQLLLDALRARGETYHVASVIVNVDLELPAFVPPAGPLFDVRLQDRDVILVRQGVKYWNAQSGLFSAAVPLTLGPIAFNFTRGWTAVDAKVRGREIRFVNTHLETQDFPPVNEAQGRELIALFQDSPLPVLLAGDFNSAANESAAPRQKTATYGAILAAGYRDLWTTANPRQEGLTCCHADDLRNTTIDFTQRIDFIFYDGRFGGGSDATLLGHRLSHRTPSGLFPSDHAGVFGRVRLP